MVDPFVPPVPLRDWHSVDAGAPPHDSAPAGVSADRYLRHESFNYTHTYSVAGLPERVMTGVASVVRVPSRGTSSFPVTAHPPSLRSIRATAASTRAARRHLTALRTPVLRSQTRNKVER